MAWTNFSLVDVNPNMELVAAGEYTFQLLGAKFSDRGDNRLEVNAAIVSDGDFAGRRMYFSYPDPNGVSKSGKPYDWSAKALKRLEQAIGVDASAGEDPATFLNRAAGSRFAAPVEHREVPTDVGDPIKRAELNIFKVRPAA